MTKKPGANKPESEQARGRTGKEAKKPDTFYNSFVHKKFNAYTCLVPIYMTAPY